MAHNGNHSFYREQEKSILGQQKWTAKRIGKLFWTLCKWLLWGFLIIATLWGCVNEFIIHTSKNLGQGVEFYQADDFIYPNTYQAVNAVGYTATEKAVTEGIKEGEANEAKSVAFNFNVINPDFDPDAEPVDGVNNTDLFVKADELDDCPDYTYNLNYVVNGIGTVSLTGMLSTDWSRVDTTSEEVDGFTVANWKLPTSVSEAANTEIETHLTEDSELFYEVKTMHSFAFYLADKSNGLDGIALNGTGIWEGFFNFENSIKPREGTPRYTYDDYVGINGGLIPAIDITTIEEATTLESYKPQFNLDLSYDKEAVIGERMTSIENQFKFAINRIAYTSGTGVATQEDLKSVVVSDGVTLYDKFIEANPALKDVEYEADMTIIKPSLPEGSDPSKEEIVVYGGAETIITPIQKGFPVRIDELGQKAIDEGIGGSEAFREKGFQNWDTSTSKHGDAGFDVENQMYGWTVLDRFSSSKNNEYQASILRVYDSALSAATNDVYADLDEAHAFYADQRREGWGSVETYNKGDYLDNKVHSVFDEKIKEWMNGKYYVSMFDSISIGGENIDYRYGAEFAGMTSIEQFLEFEDNYTGVLPQTANVGTSDAPAYTERSIMSDSIIPTGQDAWGESRVTFIGWADWGKAWDIQYGPLYGAFVFPLAQLAMIIGSLFGYLASAWGVIFSIIVIVFLTRGLGALLSIKGTANQMKMQEVQTDIAKIKARYNKYDLKADPKMKQKQQMEIMALYRKKGINPMGSLGTIFITMPIFISLWIIISSLPAYKVVFMGNFSWAISAFYGIFNSGWLLFLYLLVGISVGLVQGISSKLPSWLANKRKGIKRIDEATKEATRKQNKTQNIMIGVFVFMGLTVPALFAFYWICSGFFTIILELIKHSWKVHVAKEMKLDPTYKTPAAKFVGLFKKTKIVK